MMNAEFKEVFENHFEGCESIYDAYYAAMGYKLAKDKFSYKVGRRYIKIIRGNSVHSFVDMKEGASYGAVLKAAGWNVPAKGQRGNIFDKDNGLGRMGEYGPAYNN